MKIVFNKDIYGWIMTGIIGKNGRWFIGFSYVKNKANNSNK